eukprot:s257_g23.t1
MRRAIVLFILHILVRDIEIAHLGLFARFGDVNLEFDQLLHNGDSFTSKTSTSTASTSSSSLAFAPLREEDSDQIAIGDCLPSPTEPSLEGSTLSASDPRSHAECGQDSMALLALQAAQEAQCHSLPNLSPTVATGHGLQLRKGKGNSPRSKGQGKDVSNFQFPPPPQMPFQPNFAPPGPPLPPPSTPAPWMGQPMQMQPQMMPNMQHMPMQPMPQMSPVMPSIPQMMPGQCTGPMMPMPMPAPSLPQNSQDAAQKELIAYIRNRQADLPPDMQQKIATFSRREGAKLTKDLQTSAKHLGDVRTELEEALTARAQHIGTWKLFLAEAVRNWTDYANLFDQHERSLQARIAQAKQQFQEARDCVEEAKVAAGQVSIKVHEISDEDDMPGDQDASARQIKESMNSLSSSLTQLQKDAESIKVEVPSSKRQRRDADQEERPLPGEGDHFGAAG